MASITDEEYTKRRETIRATYGDTARERQGLYEQELARLFAESGWTQDQLAYKEKRRPKWIERHLRLGGFLISRPMGRTIKNLTERRFREYWEATNTSDDETSRFDAIDRMMSDELTLSKDRSPTKKKSIADAILEQFADGDWHRVETIYKAIVAPPEDIDAVLKQMLTRRTHNTFCERRKGGKSWSYRLTRGVGQTIDVAILFEKVSPIIRAFYVEGRKHHAELCAATIAKLAHDLKSVIEDLTHHPVDISAKRSSQQTKEAENVSVGQIGGG